MHKLFWRSYFLCESQGLESLCLDTLANYWITGSDQANNKKLTFAKSQFVWNV